MDPQPEVVPAVSQIPDSPPGGFDLEGLRAAAEQSNQALQQPEAAKPAPAAKAKKAAPAEEKPVAKPTKPWETPLEPTEEPEAQEEPQVEEPPVEMKPEAKTRWGELRKTEENYKKILPEYEQLKKEVETLKNTPAKLPDEVAAELEELRAERAAYRIESTPEWKETIDAPYADATTRLSEITDYAKVDFDKILDAARETNSIARNRKIAALLDDSEVGVTETEKMEAIKAVNDIVGLSDKAAKLKAQARDLQNGFEGKSRAAKEAEAQKLSQVLSRSAEEVATALAISFKDTALFSNADFVKELHEARPTDINEDPNYAVYEAQAAKILPAIVPMYNALAKEVKQLKKALNARNSSSPSSRAPAAGAQAPAPSNADPMDELSGIIRQKIGR